MMSLEYITRSDGRRKFQRKNYFLKGLLREKRRKMKKERKTMKNNKITDDAVSAHMQTIALLYSKTSIRTGESFLITHSNMAFDC
jgi:predicted N-acyltransferase